MITCTQCNINGENVMILVVLWHLRRLLVWIVHGRSKKKYIYISAMFQDFLNTSEFLLKCHFETLLLICLKIVTYSAM